MVAVAGGQHRSRRSGSAQKYMRARGELGRRSKPNANGASYFGGINGALKLIAKPKPSPKPKPSEPERTAKSSRKPKPGDVIVIHHDDESEPDDDEGDEVQPAMAWSSGVL